MLFQVCLKLDNCEFFGFLIHELACTHHLKGIDRSTSIVAMEGVPPILNLSLWRSLVSLVGEEEG